MYMRMTYPMQLSILCAVLLSMAALPPAMLRDNSSLGETGGAELDDWAGLDGPVAAED